MRKTIAALAAVLLAMACHRQPEPEPLPRETRSVYLPLSVGNRWVYDVTSTSEDDSAIMEVISKETTGYLLSVSCDTHFVIPVRCCDSVLELQKRGSDWYTILSDEPGRSYSSAPLLGGGALPLGGGDINSRYGLTAVVGADTYRECQQVYWRFERVWYDLWGEPLWVTKTSGRETYAPEVGLVLRSEECSGTGFRSAAWVLRHYSLADR